MNHLPSGTVTFLFTDIEGSTKLAQEYPDKWETLRKRHHAILQSAMDAHNGYVFHIIGDAFCATFHTAKDGLAAAIESQQKLQTENWGDTPIKVRMGIHTGEAELQAKGDYHGYLAMSRVQRLMSAGHGGQVLISLNTEELVRDELPEGVTLRDMGERRLKDLIRPEHIHQLVIPNLPVDFPPLTTLDIYRHNLPAQMTSFIGREKEIVEIKHALETHRLVTLTGSGGTGKTRLSLQVAADLLDQFANGVWFIELAPLTDPDLVPQALLTAMGLVEQQGKSILQSLLDFLRDKKILLVFDNCEHLIEACAKLADTLLNNAPALKILASSREALRVKGEMVWHMSSLSMPDINHTPDIEQLSTYEAIRLFIERATLAQPRFTLTKENASSITQICSRLDGMPLAIELAASRVKALSVEQIAARLDDRFRLLTGGARTALPHQQTLRALIDWSYNLLSKPEQILLGKLSVFVGGWTLEAAEKVSTDEDIATIDILDLLLQLISKSLVIVEHVSTYDVRYHFLETIRQYAGEKLAESGAQKASRNRHLSYFLQLAEQADAEMRGRHQIDWLNRLESEHDNLRAALNWSLEEEKIEMELRLATALWLFWLDGNYLQEGRNWLNAGLAQRQYLQETLLGRALRVLARLEARYGNFDLGELCAQESVTIFRNLGDKANLAWAIRALAAIIGERGDIERSEPFVNEDLLLCQELEDEWGIMQALNHKGLNAALLGDLGQGFALMEEGLKLARRLNDIYQIAFSRFCLGTIHLLNNATNFATDAFRESLTLFHQINNWVFVAGCFEGLAGACSEPLQAAQLIGVRDRLIETSGGTTPPFWAHYVREPILASVRSQLSEAAFETACAEGRAMTMEQAMELALEITNE